MMWRINRESVLLLGGPATLLMQLADPLVAAGVAYHSDFRADPIKRLRRTLGATLSIVFGDEETARRTAASVNAVHDRVAGVAPDGRRYSARDPSLLLWVHSTLVESSLRVYESFVALLSSEEEARYYEETKVVARLFEIPDDLIPPSLADLRDDMSVRIASGEVAVGALARELAEPILRPWNVVPKRVAIESAVVTAALLPRPIRDGYGLKLRRPGSALLAAGTRASRLALPLVPRRLRHLPHAQAALNRTLTPQ
jgi:uncharacterized protein (DUF2236 family)